MRHRVNFFVVLLLASSGLAFGCSEGRAAENDPPPLPGHLIVSPARLGDGVGTSTSPSDTRQVTDLALTIDARDTFPISRWVYGGNYISQTWTGAAPPKELTFNRMGGNRATAYNWETNFANAGSDYQYQNDQGASPSSAPGAAVATEAGVTFERGQAFMWTIPMIGYVAGDACMCNVGIKDADRAKRLATHFKVSKAAKGSAFTLKPDPKDGFVYQDEFVNWFESTFPGRSSNPATPVFFSLDNEPDIWHATHKEIQSDYNDNASTPRILTYTGFIDTTIVYAKAIKAVAPHALIFGPATATYTGVTKLGRHPTPDPRYGSQNFFDVYLDRMRAASAAAGVRLLDVLDLHFYPQNGTSAGDVGNDYATQDAAMIQARVQAPRSLWDPTYNDGSWVTNVTNGPIRLIPRMREQIAAHYPGTKLAITEYYYGRGGDISGGVAQADVLGIFGREGVFAAALWPNAGIWAAPYKGDGNKAFAFIFGAFKMFRNYDGAGGAFGDTGLKATTSDRVASSVYASRSAAGEIVVVAINKTPTPKSVTLTLNNVTGLASGRAYVLTGASPTPTRGSSVTMSANTAVYTMPAMSVSTIVISK